MTGRLLYSKRENTFPMQTVGCPIMLEALSKTETRCF